MAGVCTIGMKTATSNLHQGGRRRKNTQTNLFHFKRYRSTSESDTAPKKAVDGGEKPTGSGGLQDVPDGEIEVGGRSRMACMWIKRR